MDKKEYIENSINDLLKKLTPILSLGGAVIFVCLSALDYVSTPENFRTFLVYRVISATLLFMIFLVLNKYTFRSILIYKVLIFAGLLGSAITVELMVLKTGGDISAYYVGIGLVGIWGISFMPLRFTSSLMLMLALCGIYIIPILSTDPVIDFRRIFTTTVLLTALLSSLLVIRYFSFTGLVNELGLKYDLEQHKINLENQVNDRTTRLSGSIESLQKEIAEREQVELAIKKASTEWRATVDATTDVIMMLTADFKVIRVNKAAKLFFNQAYNDLIDTSLFQLFPVDNLQKEANTRSILKHSLEHQEGTVYLADKKVWLSFSIDPLSGPLCQDNKGSSLRW